MKELGSKRNELLKIMEIINFQIEYVSLFILAYSACSQKDNNEQVLAILGGLAHRDSVQIHLPLVTLTIISCCHICT